MADIATLELRVDAKDLDAANRKLQSFTNTGQRAERGAKQAAAANRRMAQSASAVAAAAAAAAAAIVAYVAVLDRIAKRGAQVIGVQNAFARATGDTVGSITELRRATEGLISDYELMVGFNRALALGAAKNAEQYGELARTGLVLGRALGVDAKFAVESLSLGIGRQSRLILDNLGLIVSAERANRDYAASINSSVESLTDAQRAEAFRIAALEAARQKVEELGGAQNTAGEAAQRFSVALANARDTIAAIIAQDPAAIKFFNTLADLVNTASEKLQTLAFWNARTGEAMLGLKAALLSVVPGMRDQADAARAESERLGELADKMLLGTLVRQQDREERERDTTATENTVRAVDAEIRSLGELARAHTAIASLRESIAAADFALQFETDAEAAQKLTEQLTKQRATLVALEAATKDYVAEFLKLNQVAERAPTIPTALPRSIGGRNAAGELQVDPVVRNQVIADLERQLLIQEEMNRVNDEGEDAVRALSKELFIMNQVLRLGPSATAAQIQAVKDLAAALFDARDAGTEENEAIRQLRDQVRVLEEGARAGVQFAAALGLIGESAARTVQDVIQLGAAVARIAGGDLAAIPSALGAIASIGSALFGGSDEDEIFRRLLTETNERLAELSRRIDNLASKLTSSDLATIADLRAFIAPSAGLSPIDQVVKAGGLGKGPTAVSDIAAAGFLGIDVEALKDRETREAAAKIIIQAFEEAFAQIQGQLVPDFAARRAELGGDSLKAAQIRREAAAAEEVRQLQLLADKGFITAEQLAEFTEVIGEELVKASKDAEEAERKRIEALQFEREMMEGSLQVRLLVAQGLDEEAAALARDLERRREMRAAVEEFGESIRPFVERVQEAEEAARAAAEAEEQLRQAREFVGDVVVREARLRGDSEAEVRALHELRAARELAAAKELLDAGTITQDLFDRLAAVLGGELARSLEAAATAAERASKAFNDSLAVRELEAEGRTDEAKQLRQELAFEEELRQAREAGRTEDQIERLIRVQNLEREALLVGATAGDRGPGRPPTIDELAKDTVVRDVAGITSTEALRLTDFARLTLDTAKESLGIEKQQLDALLALQGRGVAGSTRGGVTVNVTVQGDVIDAQSFAHTLAQDINESLGFDFGYEQDIAGETRTTL